MMHFRTTFVGPFNYSVFVTAHRPNAVGNTFEKYLRMCRDEILVGEIVRRFVHNCVGWMREPRT